MTFITLRRDPPHISHAAGRAMVIEHIEKYVCGTVIAKDLVSALEM